MAAEHARRLLADYGIEGDEDRISATESETNFAEVVGRMMEADYEDEATINACKDRIAELKAKIDVTKDRRVCRKVEIGQAMESVGLEGTVNCGTSKVWRIDTPGRVIVTNPDELPAEYWRETTTREPNLQAIADALKNAVQVPGATKSNGGVSISSKRAT